MNLKYVIPVALVVAAVIGGVLLLTNRDAETVSQPPPTTRPATTTEAAPVDNETAALDACQQSIIQRAADHPILGDPDLNLTWESNTTTHPAPGQYDIDGFVIAGQGSANYWRFSYTCQMAAEQSGDGSGRWVAVDNGYEQLTF